jgi:hypothetical protein
MRRAGLLAIGVAAFLAPGAALAKAPEGDAAISSLEAARDGVWAWAADYRLLVLDPATARVTRQVDTSPALVLGLARGAGGLWGAGICGRPRCRYGVLMGFDPVTGRRSRPLIRLGLTPRAVAAGYGAVWVLGGRRVLRVDARTRRVSASPIAIGRGGRAIAAGAGAVGVTTGPGRRGRGGPACRLVGIDPRRSLVVRRQPVPCTPAALAVGPGGLWTTASTGTRGLSRAHPFRARDPLRGLRLPGETVGVAAGFGRAWAAGVDRIVAGRWGARRGRLVLTPVDARTGLPGPARVLGRALAWQPRVAAGAGAGWVANAPAGTIARVDPATGAVTARVTRPGRG